MSGPVLPSADLARRIHQTELTYTRQRLGVLQRLPGNPVGVEMEDLGDGGWFLQARYIPNIHFNRVGGLAETHIPRIAALADRYAQRGVAGMFDVIPGLTPEPVIEELQRVGIGHKSFHATLAAVPSLAPAASPGVTIERVTERTLDTFLDCHCRGWNIPDPAGFKNNVRGWGQEPDWTLYLARLNGLAAGTAVLSAHGSMGYCADSACDPAFRAHGVHAALLHRRLEDAAAASAQIVCAMANVGSTSHRNMVRAGFALAYTKSIWGR
jgi:Acetyltransferase (GNAT) domain